MRNENLSMFDLFVFDLRITGLPDHLVIVPICILIIS